MNALAVVNQTIRRVQHSLGQRGPLAHSVQDLTHHIAASYLAAASTRPNTVGSKIPKFLHPFVARRVVNTALQIAATQDMTIRQDQLTSLPQPLINYGLNTAARATGHTAGQTLQAAHQSLQQTLQTLTRHGPFSVLGSALTTWQDPGRAFQEKVVTPTAQEVVKWVGNDVGSQGTLGNTLSRMIQAKGPTWVQQQLNAVNAPRPVRWVANTPVGRRAIKNFLDNDLSLVFDSVSHGLRAYGDRVTKEAVPIVTQSLLEGAETALGRHRRIDQPVQRPKLQGFRNMTTLQGGGSSQVGQRARHTEHPVKRPAA